MYHFISPTRDSALFPQLTRSRIKETQIIRVFLSRSLNYEKLRKVKKKKVNYEKRTEGR